MSTARQDNVLPNRLWIRRDVAGIPSMAHFSGQTDHVGRFVVIDPAAGRKILPDGTATSPSARLGRAGALMLLAWCAVLVGVAATALADRPTAAGFVGGVFAGLLVGGLVLLLVNAALELREHSRTAKAGTPTSWVVRPTDERAWRLCEITARISSCSPWQDHTVDTARQVPALLWSAVGRSITVERRRRDADQALQHESLRDLARETLQQVERETRSLEAVESNLNRVLITAWQLQQRRAQALQDARDGRRRRAEEQELRARLTRSSPQVDALESDHQADRSAGLAAEVAAVSELLADAEQMLRETEAPSRLSKP